MATIKRTFGQQTIGGGGSAPAAAAPEHKVLQILYGQTVAGINCIKHTGTIPSSISPAFSGASYVFNTSFTPEGVGSAYLWTNGVRSENPVFVINNNAIYNHLLLSGATVTTYQTVSISAAGITPPVFIDFHLPYGA